MKTLKVPDDFILRYPACVCGWVGEKAAVFGAGCPKCGERIFNSASRPNPPKLPAEARELAAADPEEDQDDNNDEEGA